MLDPIQKEVIKDFWRWFTVRQKKLFALLDSGRFDELASLIDEEINKLNHDLSWEMGPGLKKPYMLSLGFNGMEENIPIVRSIIEESPKYTDCEIYVGRPEKTDWNGELDLGERNRTYRVNVSEWRCILVPLKRVRKMELIFRPKAFDAPDSLLTQAATLTALNLLGELNTTTYISSIRVGLANERKSINDAFSIFILKSRFDDYLKGKRGHKKGGKHLG